MNSKSQGRSAVKISEGPYFGNDFEGDISIRDSESIAYQTKQENVQVFIRVRPPFQQEVDDPIFDPSPQGAQLSS